MPTMTETPIPLEESPSAHLPGAAPRKDAGPMALEPTSDALYGQDTHPRPGVWVLYAKRCFDVVIALLLILFLSCLLLALAWWVRRDGKPALYRHPRLGINGKPFDCLKFRSMVANADIVLAELLTTNSDARAEWDATQKLRCDPRLTKVGKFLRNTSLDELPQLFNVLRGEMSLVGPRPIVAAETRFYGPNIRDYFATRPGITGLWQVSGRSDTTYERRVALDVAYVRDQSLGNDITILLKTLPVVLLRRGAV